MTRLLRWNDPSEDVEHIEPNATRNYGQRWGPQAIKGAIERLRVDFVIRGHQAMTNGVRRFANLPLATVFSSSYYLNEENFGAVLFVNPVKNEIVPIFIVSHKDSIETQEEFDEKLREGWKVDDYAVIPDDITVKGEKKSSLFASKAVLHAKDCDKPCEYQFGAATYEDCVILDISDPVGIIPFFTARRTLSGPYATFMDETENLMLGAILPFSSQNEKNGRVRRQDDIPEKIQYPRCINVAGLAGEDLKRVKDDLFLNCDTNIFVQFRNGNTSGLAIDPPPCEGANDTKICTHRYGVPTETTHIPATIAAAALSTETLIGIGAGVGGVVLLLLCGVLLGCMLKK
ncbi:unnamed protein product, partial [Mesorhabditis spiculigera]